MRLERVHSSKWQAVDATGTMINRPTFAARRSVVLTGREAALGAVGDRCRDGPLVG